MRIAIITNAGISSRFNDGIPESEKKLKAIYSEDGSGKDTLFYHMVAKCNYADRIVVVGGYKYDDYKNYIDEVLPSDIKEKIDLVYNEHYKDLASGYSLYMGLCKAFEYSDIEDILFVEGDLDIDKESMNTVIKTKGTVLTTSPEPIYANKAVVLYRDGSDNYKYAFNSSHGLLKIDDPFSVILNSGQCWKFNKIDILKEANHRFYAEAKDGTNLIIIQNYLDNLNEEPKIVNLTRWTNCNTRDDYKNIKKFWENEE